MIDRKPKGNNQVFDGSRRVKTEESQNKFAKLKPKEQSFSPISREDTINFFK
jgi:hypothetical protein